MAEWLYERGIGEDRAIFIEDGRIAEAAIELPGCVKAGAVLPARLSKVLIPGRRGLVALNDEEALLEPIPAALSEGSAFHAEIVRESLCEAGKAKLAKVRATDDPLRDAPSLAARTGAAAASTFGRDLFEQAGWSELLEEAATGEIAFPGGALRMSLTPAMTLFDVDGHLPLAELAEAGAAAAARTIRRFGIGGSIGIDLPTVGDRAARQRAATLVDAILPQPFERTSVNGFGFLQIVRRRRRPSLPEIVQADPVSAAARALLRRAERAGPGPLTLHAAPAVVARIEASPEWLARLERRTGASIGLRAEGGLAISAGHVQSRQS